jgi:hypothetical protein
MSPGPAFASSSLVATAFGVVVAVLDVCGWVVVGVEGAVLEVVPEPVVLVLLPVLGVGAGLVLPVVESSVVVELLESGAAGLVSVDSVSVAVSSLASGVRQNISHKISHISPIRTSADTISQIMRPIFDGSRCSYICLASRVSYSRHN